MINVLVLSCGTRNKIIQYFRRELDGKGKVFAADCSPLAPALYEADQHFLVPRIHEPQYVEHILSLCKEYAITCVLSLIDPELTLLAENKARFENLGTQVMISNRESVLLAFNKFNTQKILRELELPYIKTYLSLSDFQTALDHEEMKFPIFVKPNQGSASLHIQKVDTLEEVQLLFQKYENLVIQEYIQGKEYGVDTYIDMKSGQLCSVFMKEKIVMRAGETDKARSVYIPKIQELLETFFQKIPFQGVLDVDVFERDGVYYLSEINPRFGGGYPHAYECGMNFISLLIKNLEGHENLVYRDSYEEGVYMMKYNEVMIRREN